MAKKRVIITGGTGFIGKALSASLVDQGYEVVVLTRNIFHGSRSEAAVKHAVWDAKTSAGWLDQAEGAYAIINLAGENVAQGRWTEERKRLILQSRLEATAAVMDALKRCKKKPSVLIQASAAGYYGAGTGTAAYDETSASGEGFLADVTRQWEMASEEADKLGVRRVVIRTGVVLGLNGGALVKLVLPYRFFVGGYIGSGSQYMPWIHLDDEVRAVLFLMEKKNLDGVFNLTAPKPETAKEFSRVLGRAMKRPAWTKIPSFAIRLVFGEMGTEALLSGKRVVPKRLLSVGFSFKYAELEGALKSLL
ncbi:MAG TPA: TIGR01777 family oxidoreductase [Spirochaetota bacterium]|nr:TIGR01777 family oxidoreductase [Spirochaetota bacterium]HPI89627.1 TIGR01777 family oxidoreductase [Spirochaetota bacterium]HPR49206.1 TIGR01777 family oxidoreductase [Spirochaetota bacterium]